MGISASNRARPARRLASFAALALSSPLFADDAVDVTDVTARVNELVEERLGSEAAQADDTESLFDLGMDEVKFVEMKYAIEKEFGIEIADQDIEPPPALGWPGITTRFYIEVVVKYLRKRKG
jgi:acyl carrier protein